jgi:hypothetical protein
MSVDALNLLKDSSQDIGSIAVSMIESKNLSESEKSPESEKYPESLKLPDSPVSLKSPKKNSRLLNKYPPGISPCIKIKNDKDKNKIDKVLITDQIIFNKNYTDITEIEINIDRPIDIEIPSCMFSYCEKLTKITIKNNKWVYDKPLNLSIGAQAFSNCKNLKDIDIKGYWNIKIGLKAFENCVQLSEESIKYLSEKSSEIGEDAFKCYDGKSRRKSTKKSIRKSRNKSIRKSRKKSIRKSRKKSIKKSIRK